MPVPRAQMMAVSLLPQRHSSWERIGGHDVMDEVCDSHDSSWLLTTIKLSHQVKEQKLTGVCIGNWHPIVWVSEPDMAKKKTSGPLIFSDRNLFVITCMYVPIKTYTGR